MKSKKIRISDLKVKKTKNEKITCLTAYDCLTAKIIDEAGIDLILVGDSLGMVCNGYKDTLRVTIDEIIYHTKAVKRGISRSFLVSDMPFGSYQTSTTEAMKNCVKVIKESGSEAVKMEGGSELSDLVQKLTTSGINVVGHIGLMPQYLHKMGGYKIQGRKGGADKLINDAIALEQAGVSILVLEGIVEHVAKEITSKLNIPTIGIGSGIHTDGQILVFHDVFGINKDFAPSFVKKYSEVGNVISDAAKEYIKDVKSLKFPEEKHTFR